MAKYHPSTTHRRGVRVRISARVYVAAELRKGDRERVAAPLPVANCVQETSRTDCVNFSPLRTDVYEST